jgi:predicted ATPase
MIKSVRLVNFFSFGDCTIDLESDLNVLVGINGSGKSNFLRAFQLLKAGLDGRLREQIVRWGGVNSIHQKNINRVMSGGEASLEFSLLIEKNLIAENIGKNFIYKIILRGYNEGFWVEEVIRGANGVIYFDSLTARLAKSGKGEGRFQRTEEVQELMLPKRIFEHSLETDIFFELVDLEVYKQFNTEEDAPMRNSIRATGVNKLLPNGDNVFQAFNAVGLKSIPAQDAIEAGLRDVNENFQRFRPNIYGQGVIEFLLQEKGLDTPIHAAQISDGTLCYLCLLVALHQPDRGSTILFDEPERNLHPDMLFELGRQLEKASEKSQIILTTHAPGLVNQFPLRAVRVFEKDENNQTIVNKFTEEDFAGWYDEFAPGQMWRDGALGGNR